MPAMRFTDAGVRNLKVPRKGERGQVPYFETLERGLALVLVVSYGGSKTWRVMTYVHGKPQSRKLGTYPEMKVKDARKAARDYREDPGKFEKEAATGLFEEVAENWFKRHVEGGGLRSKSEVRRILAKYVYPEWKHRPFLEIRRSEVSALLDKIEDNHGKAQADAVLAVVRGICVWHQARDEHYISPVVKGMRRNKRRSRDRVLTADEIRAVWKAADASGTFGSIVKVLLLTGQRRQKVGTMRRDDIARDVWTIPAEDRQKGTAGVIALPRLVTKIIEEQLKRNDAQLRFRENPHVFPGGARGRRTKKKQSGPLAFNSWSQCKQELDELLPGLKHWTLHDLRRTGRSLMSRAGVRPDIAERVLGHAIPGVEGVYDRHEYREEKADALNRLAALVQTIINPPKDNVIAMPIRRKRD